MKLLSDIPRKIVKSKAKNLLEGAIGLAIEDARRFGTNLVVAHNGKIEEITPAAMKRRLARRKS